MGRAAKRKRERQWLSQREPGALVQYAELDPEEAVTCGATVLAFHPENSQPLAMLWPDGCISFNASYFSPSDATELVMDAAKFARGSK